MLVELIFFPRSPASLTEETSFPYYFVFVLGDIVPTATIYQNLKHIVEDPSPPPKFPGAAVTTENRDTWANIRRALQAEPSNEEALRLIDSAIFVLCLDDHGVESVADVTRSLVVAPIPSHPSHPLSSLVVPSHP